MLILLLLLFPVVVWSLGDFFFVLLSISLCICTPFLLCLCWGLRFMYFQPSFLWVARNMLKGKQVVHWI